MTAEIEQGRKPVTVKLTTAVMSLVGAIFVVLLTATVTVLRVSDRLQMMQATMDNVNARVEKTLGQSEQNSVDLANLREHINQQRAIDSIKETLRTRGR